MARQPKAATRMVATVLGPAGNPAKDRIAGLTTMMYAIVVNVVRPPRISVRALDPRAWTRKKSRAMSGDYGPAACLLLAESDAAAEGVYGDARAAAAGGELELLLRGVVADASGG